MKIEVEKLKNKIEKYKNILILTHDQPDPDAICCGMLFQNICKKYGVNATLSYGGVIKRRENIKMVEELKIDIRQISTINVDDFDGFALVDTQKSSKNHSLPDQKVANFTVDHHIMRGDRNEFELIDEKVGASATILMNYYEAMGIVMDEVMASAYCYSILADTKEFSREFSDKDVYYYKKYLSLANLETIAVIKQVKKPIELYEFFDIGFNSRIIKKRTFVTYLGLVSTIDYISELSDMFSNIEEIDSVLVVGKLKEGGYAMSARTVRNDIDLSQTLYDLCLKYGGNGGGHRKMSAGKFSENHEKLIEDFFEMVE